MIPPYTLLLVSILVSSLIVWAQGSYPGGKKKLILISVQPSAQFSQYS